MPGSSEDEVIGGLNSYTSGYPSSKLAILMISNIFGYKVPKFRQIADKVAAAGFYVVVPDFFYGDAYVDGNPDRPIPSWLLDHPYDKGCEDARNVVADLKRRGASSIGVAGFCWGGVVVSKQSADGETKATVMLHPNPLSENDVDAIIVPTAILGAEHDKNSPPKQLEKFGEILSANSVENYVKIFLGVDHGWTVDYDDDDEHAVECAMEAQFDMLNWFIKYVK